MSSIQALMQEGLNAYQNRNYEQAIEIFQQLVNLDPSNAGAWENLGLSLEWLQKYQEAENALSKAISRAPEAAGLYMERGHTKMRQQKYEEAIEDFHRAFQLADVYLEYGLHNLFLYKGECYEALGKYEQAIKSYQSYASALRKKHVAEPYIKRVKEKMAQVEQSHLDEPTKKI